MNTDLQVAAAVVLIAGSMLFIAGAFMPVARLYAYRAPAEKLAIMQGNSVGWNIHLALMGTGSIVALPGLALTAYQSAAGASTPLAHAVLAAAVPGTTLWLRHLYLRTVDPVGFATGALPSWHFRTYSLLMQAALLALGVLFFLAEFPLWIGAVVSAGALLTFAAYLVFDDMPPFAYYVLTLVAGIGLLA